MYLNVFRCLGSTKQTEMWLKPQEIVHSLKPEKFRLVNHYPSIRQGSSFAAPVPPLQLHFVPYSPTSHAHHGSTVLHVQY